jgi:hypothetical protein
MKRLLVFSLFLLVAVNTVHAQLPIGLSFGARGGLETKESDFLVGGQVELKAPFITIVPSYERILIKDVATNRINIDLQYTVFSLAVAKLFAGGGYVINSAKPKGLDSVSENGFNLQVGGKAGLSKLGVFGLARYTKIEKETSIALVAGVNFSLL